MEIISLDIEGKFAHFRKIYANNTAFSYSIPPRTTIIGMLASLMGKEKESYYESLSSKNIRIGIRVMSPLKKSFHRLNILKILGPNDFKGKLGRIQTPFEIISGINIRTGLVKYRIYISFHERGIPQFNEIKKILLSKKYIYNLTMGTANFSGSIKNINFFNQSFIKLLEPSNQFINIHSATCSTKVEQIGFSKDKKLLLDEEMIPIDFKENNNRELSSISRVLFSIDKNSMPLILNSPYYQITEGVNNENITFIEE